MALKSRVPGWILAFALFPIGLGGLVWGPQDALEGRRSLSWPAVQAVVLSSTVAPRWLGPSQPQIRYSYRVGNEAFVSNRIWVGDGIANFPVMGGAFKLVEKFPEGSEVEAAFNPNHPAQSALVRGPARAYRWLAAFLLVTLLGIFSPFAVDKIKFFHQDSR